MLYDKKPFDKEIKIVVVSLFAMLGISIVSSSSSPIPKQSPKEQPVILDERRIFLVAKRRTINKYGQPYGPQFTELIYLN